MVGYCLGSFYATLSAYYWKGQAGIVLDRPVPSYSTMGTRLLFLLPSFLALPLIEWVWQETEDERWEHGDDFLAPDKQFTGLLS